MDPKLPDFSVHTSDNFHEQIGVLYGGPSENGYVYLQRSFVQTCTPGMATFDPHNPGEFTDEAWRIMDDYIENQGVVGFFHTHPPGCWSFSSRDVKSHIVLAKTYGSRKIWHGVQAASTEMLAGLPKTGKPAIRSYGSRFVCYWMENRVLYRYVYDVVEDNLTNPNIVLHVPPTLGLAEDGVFTVYES